MLDAMSTGQNKLIADDAATAILLINFCVNLQERLIWKVFRVSNISANDFWIDKLIT
jgi:hypothetical protein